METKEDKTTSRKRVDFCKFLNWNSGMTVDNNIEAFFNSSIRYRSPCLIIDIRNAITRHKRPFQSWLCLMLCAVIIGFLVI